MWNSKRIVVIILIMLFFSTHLFAQDEKFVYPDLRDLERDPFEALINAEGIVNVRLVRQFGDLELNGILYSQVQQDRIAVINNIPLKENDYIGAYKIEEIKQEEVILNKKGKKIIIRIKEAK